MKRITMLLGAGILFLCSTMFAAVPQLINFQGILRDGGGNPVADGSYSVQFTIYDAAVAGANLWQETQTVNTTNGLFTVLLGSGPIPLDYSIFNDSTRWLGVKVGADPEMTPRRRISSVGYSHNSSEWTSAAQDLFRLNGNIGIGTSPSNYTKLRVVDTLSANPNDLTAVRGEAVKLGGGGTAYGGYFTSTGTGVFASGLHGVVGQATGGNGVSGYSNTGTGVYAYGAADGVNCLGDASSSSPIYGCYSRGLNSSTGDAYGGYFSGSSIGGTSYGVYGDGASYGVYGNSLAGLGVYGYSSGYYGVWGQTGSSSYAGVFGQGPTYGTYGAGNTGVYGVSFNNGGYGVYGWNGGNSLTWAGYFVGDSRVTGNLSVDGFIFKNGGGFKIDHPTDPANKYLYHSFVESPDMKNIYDGVVVTDSKGEATVALPDWFDAVNGDFRYQLTVIGEFAQAIISKKIEGNRFTIKTDKPNIEVSWQVTGIRKDAYAEAHRIPVEEVKSGKEKGKYLHPEEFGVSKTLGLHYEEEQKLAAEQKQMQEQQAKMEAERKLHEEERAKLEQAKPVIEPR